MDSMKAAQYKEAHRRLKYSGLYREVPDAEKSAILAAWDANTDTLGRGEAFFAKGREKHIDNILLARGVDIAEVPVKKLYAHLNRGISFGKLVVVLERSLGAHNRAVQVAEELFVAVDRIPPVPRELHEQMLKTQEKHLPERLKPHEAGFPAKEWLKAQLRPIMKRPLAIAAQAHLKEVRRLNDEAAQQQDFLPDGRPAGIQHVLREQAVKQAEDDRMKSMNTVERGGTEADINPELVSRTEDDLKKLFETARQNPNALSFKDKLVLNALCNTSGSSLIFTNSAHERVRIDCTPSILGRKYKIHNGAEIKDVLVSLSEAEQFEKLWQADAAYINFSNNLEERIKLIAPNDKNEQSKIKSLLQGDPWVNHFFRILTAETTAEDIRPHLESFKNAEKTSDNVRTYAALTALAQAASFTELSELFYVPDGRKVESPDQKSWPKEIKQILIHNKEYLNKGEKDEILSLLDLPDGSNRKWRKIQYSINTTSDGTRTYTGKDKKNNEFSFVLTAAEIKKLRDTDVKKESPESEKKNRAIEEIRQKYNVLSGLTAPVPAEKEEIVNLFKRIRDERPQDFQYEFEGGALTLVRHSNAQAAREGRQRKDPTEIYIKAEKDSQKGTKGHFPINIVALNEILTRLEGKKNEDLKIPADLKSALGVLPVWDKAKYFDNDAQRTVLDKYLKPLGDSSSIPKKIGEYDVTDISPKYEFYKNGKLAFFVMASQVALWKEISAVVKPPEPPRLPPSDALPPGALEKSIVGEAGWEDELGRRIGTKLLMGKLGMEQGQISKEKALNYVKGLGFWKRMGLYAALAIGTAAVAIGASYLIGAGIAATIGWGAAFSAKWFGLMGLKIAGTAGVAFVTNHLLRKKWLDKMYGLTGANGEPLITFMERSKDAARYYRALNEFRKEKKIFDKKEGKLVRAKNSVRSTSTPEFKASQYQMGMDAVMAHGEKGAVNERRRQFFVPIAIGGGIAGATAWYHWDIIKSLMPGTRPPSGAGPVVPPPTGSRGGPPIAPRGPATPPQGPGFVQDSQGRWILPNSGRVIEVHCGAPRATCIPCDFTINGTRAHWYINSFTDSMRVSCPKGGMSYLLGNMNAIPGGRATQEQVWALFERTLCADRDLYKTFYNVGNSSRGKWIDFAVLKETTWIGGRKQAMIDVMIDRAQNENVRSTLRAIRESIIQNNPRLSVRLAR